MDADEPQSFHGSSPKHFASTNELGLLFTANSGEGIIASKHASHTSNIMAYCPEVTFNLVYPTPELV